IDLWKKTEHATLLSPLILKLLDYYKNSTHRTQQDRNHYAELLQLSQKINPNHPHTITTYQSQQPTLEAQYDHFILTEIHRYLEPQFHAWMTQLHSIINQELEITQTRIIALFQDIQRP